MARDVIVSEGEGRAAALPSHDFCGTECFYRGQVAEILGVTPRAVNLMLKRGALESLGNVVTVWNHFPVDVVVEFARTYRKGARRVS